MNIQHLQEPLTEFTAEVVVDILPGNIIARECHIGGSLARPDIIDMNRLHYGDIRVESVTPRPENGKPAE